MPSLLAGGLVESYYRSIDAADIDAVVALFAEDAVYERAETVYAGRPRIADFFRHERRISGRHEIELILSLDDRVVSLGRFEGQGERGDAKSIAFAEIWEFDAAGLVRRRRTFLAAGSEIVKS